MRGKGIIGLLVIAAAGYLGSFACRNIYHRENARLSEHATADARLRTLSLSITLGEKWHLS